MDPILDLSLRHIQKRRQITIFLDTLLVIACASLLGLTAFYTWAYIKPGFTMEQLSIGFIAFLTYMIFGLKQRWKIPSERALLTHLEINFPKIPVSAFNLKQPDLKNAVWQKPLNTFLEDEKKRSNRQLLTRASQLIIPALLCALSSSVSSGEIKSVLREVQTVVTKLSSGVELKIIKGRTEDKMANVYRLSIGAPVKLDLLDQNMIEIKLVSDIGKSPFVKLKPIDEEGVEQTFRLTQSVEELDNKALGVYVARFAVSKSSLLYVSSISIREPAAQITLQRLPVPIVGLTSQDKIDGLWPDEKPLSLRISAKGENPLAQIRLVIKSGNQDFKELVTSVMAKDRYEIEVPYSLLLESYVRQDIADVEIVAEAIDRAIPIPLLGRSEPLLIRTASAYGRYRTTLNLLKSIKVDLDQIQSIENQTLPLQLSEKMDEAFKKSQSSPFFDGLDRFTLRQIKSDLRSLTKQANRGKTLAVAESLSQFLFEHETLNDRERDRDFFVAARTLSRLIEEKASKRKVSVEIVAGRMQTFLDERLLRWRLRVGFIGNDNAPKAWAKVKQKSFQKKLRNIEEKSKKEDTLSALNKLSGLVADYKKWIEDLEKKEDDFRKKMAEQKRQGIANARNALRKLQQTQGKISQKLDRAAAQKRNVLKDNWPSTRMEQNGNVQATRKLEAQLKSLSPMAAERIEAARKSMQMTVDSGNQDNFPIAESSADLAGRLLRQADSAAQRSMQQNQNRGRRRRVASDQYFGSPVAGGDVEIRQDYSVNPRYREEIIDDVRRLKNRQEKQKKDRLLEDYLRQVVR